MATAPKSPPRAQLLVAALLVMAALATLKLGSELPRLLWQPPPHGAVDLHRFHNLVQRWFSGQPVYGAIPVAVYPPATPVLLWPLLGWLGFGAARWLWALTTSAALVWLVRLLWRHAGVRDPLQAALVALLPLSMNATGVTVGNGQMGLHVLPALIAMFALLERNRGNLLDDLAIAALFSASLVKPSFSAPFFAAVVLLPGRTRPALLAVALYGALSLVATAFQPAPFSELSRQAVHFGIKGADIGEVLGGYGNLHSWLEGPSRHDARLVASFSLLAILSVWIWVHRRASVWIVLGVSAIAARVWAYHRAYDDVLLVLPMLPLYQIARSGEHGPRTQRLAAALLGTLVGVMMLPARLQHGAPVLFATSHVATWAAVLVFLLTEARRAIIRGRATPACAPPSPSA